jgi:hypothetical protein
MQAVLAMPLLWRFWHAASDPLRAHWRDLLLANAAYFGLVLVGAVVSARDPDIQQALLRNARQALTTGPLAVAVQAYAQRNLPLAIGLTFGFNLVFGSAFFLTLPSFALPFAGVVLGLLRAFMWGLLFAPTSRELALAMIPNSATMLLEGEAYVIAVMGAFVLWRDVLWPEPRTIARDEGPRASPDRARAYVAGLRLNLRLYVPISVVLFIAAVYEVLAVVYIVPRLLGR